MRLVSYPLSVLAVVAASYGLAHVAARPTVAAASAVRTRAGSPAAGRDLGGARGGDGAVERDDRVAHERAGVVADRVRRRRADAVDSRSGAFARPRRDAHGPHVRHVVRPVGGHAGFGRPALLRRIHTPDAGPRFLTLTNHFYSRAAPLPQGRALYPPLVANADVIGFDLYPLQSWCRFDSFGDVYDAQQELVRLAQGKPTFQWIEARAMDCAGDPALDPTPATVRAETWLAIAGGAHGIGYFPKDWSPEIGAEIAREKAEIETLAPALTAPAIPGGAEGDV